MVPVIFFLAILILTSASLARPLRRMASPPSCALDQPSMPNLHGLILRSSPRVAAQGRLIKGLYYSESQKGPHTLAAFFIACDRILEPNPFLVMDFRSRRYSFDGDRNGCSDATGLMPLLDIDPADFYPAVDQSEKICGEDAVSDRQASILAAVP